MGEVVKRALLTLPVAVVLHDAVASVSPVQGRSMQPTLNNDLGQREWVLVDRTKVRHGRLQRGDVVTFRSPYTPHMTSVKRVVALEHDVVRHADKKQVYTTVPSGHCWVEGDNHEHSADSNSYGAIPQALLVGVVRGVVWPPSNARWIGCEDKAGTRLVRRA